jgi:LysM repeat protein
MKIILTESQYKLLMESVAPDKAVIWAKKFKNDLGLTDEAAAAMAANIEHESGFEPDRIQIGGGRRNGTMSQSGSYGYSWAQWTFGKRKIAFRNFVKKNYDVDINKTPATDEQAYAFLKYELLNPTNELYKNKSLKYHNLDFDSFKKSKNVNSATKDFVTYYEGAGKPMLGERQRIATDILTALKGMSKPTPKPIVKKQPPKDEGLFAAIDMVKNATKDNIYYTVQSGETLSSIAAKYDKTVTTDSIRKLNALKTDKLSVGQKLKIK